MRILLISDNPLSQSAYAQQSLVLAQALKEAGGHEVLVYSYNYFGRPLNLGGVTVVGTANFSAIDTLDLVPYYITQFNPDIIFTYKDPYIFPRQVTRQWAVPWVALAPVDSLPVAGQSVDALQSASHIITFSEHSRQVLAASHLNAFVAPPGFDPEFFTPGETDFRERNSIAPDTFVALAVAHNSDPEDRKNFRQLLLSWQRFVAQVDQDAVLVLHTNITPTHGGIDVLNLCDALDFITGDMRRNLRLANAMQYVAGYDAEYVRDLMRGADVLVAVGNEGFGCPVIEAAGCGTPSLSIQFGGLIDTFCGGWQIGVDDATGLLDWTRRGGMWFRPNVRILTAGLKRAREERHTEGLSEACRSASLRFALGNVLEQQWLPIFAKIEAELKEAVLE